MKDIETFTEPLSDDEHLIYIKGIINTPSRFHLIDVLKDIKNGRPANNQHIIQKWIKELENEPEKGVPFS